MLVSTLVLVVAASTPTMTAAGPAEVARTLADAQARWDSTAALEVLAGARMLARREPSAVTKELHVRAGLLAAELLRVGFEETPTTEPQARAVLGAQIDAIAEEALTLLTSLAESSERFRIEADLVATMIRSDFRAKKYESRFRRATGRALELDPGNVRAIVSSAKPALFAPVEHGGDLREGVRILDRALALDPRLEPALLLRAYAYDRLGERSLAEADWRAALRINPKCEPARRGLAGPPPSPVGTRVPE